jgi:hypothetical protein
LNEGRNESLPRAIVFIEQHEHADAPQPSLLRPRDHRPRRRSAKSCKELPPQHS